MLSAFWKTAASATCFGLAFRSLHEDSDLLAVMFVGLALLFFLYGLLTAVKQ
jgi:hypothetical protein